MIFSKAVTAVVAMAVATTPIVSAARRLNETESANQPNSPECTLQSIPINDEDFGEPAWEAILELAFPTWTAPANGCPRLDALGGKLSPEYSEFTEYEDG